MKNATKTISVTYVVCVIPFASLVHKRTVCLQMQNINICLLYADSDKIKYVKIKYFEFLFSESVELKLFTCIKYSVRFVFWHFQYAKLLTIGIRWTKYIIVLYYIGNQYITVGNIDLSVNIFYIG